MIDSLPEARGKRERVHALAKFGFIYFFQPIDHPSAENMTVTSMILGAIKFLVSIYAIVLVLLYILQGRLIFFAQPINNPYVNQFAEHEIEFNHDGVLLHGWFIRRNLAEESSLIIYFGGNAEEVSGNLLDLNRFPQSSLLFVNYRGYGKSQGKPSEKNLVKDALFVFDQMVKKEGIAPDRIILLGRSLGSGVAVQVAAKRTVQGMILVTPFDSLVNVAKSHYPVFPVGLAIRHRFDSMAHASAIDCPALILIGTEDQVIPRKHPQALAKAWGGPVTTVIVEGAGHNDIQSFQEYWTAMHAFLKEA